MIIDESTSADADDRPLVRRWSSLKSSPILDDSFRSQGVRVGFVVLAFVVWTAITGKLSLDQTHVFLWIVLGLASVSLHDMRHLRHGIVRDWAPLFLILWAYGWLRSQADNLGANAHAMSQIRFDEFVLHGHVATVVLQSHFFHPDAPHWWDYVGLTVYMSHFVASFLVAAVLWKVNHAGFRTYMTAFVVLTFSAFITFLMYPALPPWLASGQGLLPPAARTIHATWQYVDVRSVSSLFSPHSHDSNPVAAVPSLHSAYPMLLLAYFWGAGWRARIPLAIYTVAMAVTLLYSGEHYLLDIMFGWTYAIIAMCVVRLVQRARAQRSVVTPQLIAATQVQRAE